MQATLTPTRTGFQLAAAAADAWLALRAATARRLQAWREAHERRQTERALRQLSPWLLRDLGLDASDIPSIAAATDGADATRRLLMVQR
jgi:uncharacterized protein YjiS (DUF1127 family)